MANYRNIVIEQTTGEVELSGSTNSSHLIFLSLISQTGGTLNANLEACWNFEEASGTLYDYTSGNHDFGTNGIMQYQLPGKVDNYCFDFFDTSTGQAVCSTALDATTLSFSMWIRYTGSTGTMGIYTRYTGNAGSGGVVIQGSGSGTISFKTLDTTNTPATNTGSITTNDNTWHHIVITYDGSTYESNIYVDNVLDNTNSPYDHSAYPLDYGAGGGSIYLNQANGSAGFGGSIDALAIWSRVLDATEVNTLWNNGNGLTCSGV